MQNCELAGTSRDFFQMGSLIICTNFNMQNICRVAKGFIILPTSLDLLSVSNHFSTAY